MAERRTRSGGAAQRSGPRTSLTKPSKSSKRKSGSDLPNSFSEIWPRTTPAVPVRKAIVLKKIVAHAVEVPDVHTVRRSPRISFILEKENNPPLKVPTKEDLFKTCSVPGTPSSTPVLYTQNVEPDSGEAELDSRDLEMSQKVRRSYSRLQSLGCASTSTPGRRSFFGFEGPDDLPGVSPVVCSKLIETPKVPAKDLVPARTKDLVPDSTKDLVPARTLPGISPPVVKEKRKKKVPEILPTVVYEDLESIMIIPEESRLTQETDEDSQVKAEGHSRESKGQPASRGHSGETRGYPGGSRGYPGGSRGYPGGSPTS